MHLPCTSNRSDSATPTPSSPPSDGHRLASDSPYPHAFMAVIETPPQGVDYSRKWYVLVAIAMAIFLGTIDGSIVNVALPTLAEEFDTTFGVAQWVVLAYLLTQATLTLSFGRLGDMIGKKPIFTAGFAVFTFGSVLAGLSPTIGFLIAARVVQALGAAMIFALGFAITTEAFPPSERGKALGINGTTVSLGIMAGPILGGIILEATDWRWIFFVNLPIGIIGTITAVKFVPNTKPKGKQRFDFAGAATFFVALLSLLLALTMGQNVGFTDPLDPRRVRGFSGSVRRFRRCRAAGCPAHAEFGSVPKPRPLGQSDHGIRLVLRPFGPAAGRAVLPHRRRVSLAARDRPRARRRPDHDGYRRSVVGIAVGSCGLGPVTVAGLVLMTIAYGIAAWLIGDATTSLVVVVVGLIIGLGMGIFQSPNNSAILGSVPLDQLGVTSGMLTINRTTASVTGIAVLGTLWAARTAVYGGVGDAADAPAAAQAAGLADTMVVATLLVAGALLLGLWAWLSKGRP